MSLDERSTLPLHDLTAAECLRLMAGEPIGRLAFSSDSGMVVLPINFAIRNGQVVISTSAYGVIAREALGEVAFEVDRIDSDRHSGWSVLIQGRLGHDLTEGLGTHERVIAAQPWPEGVRTMRLVIEPREISGRRLGAG